MIKFYMLHRKNSKTGIRLAAAMEWEHGSQAEDVPGGDTLLVRWGNALTLPRGTPTARTINSADAIRLAANKYESLLKMKAANVSCLTPVNGLIQSSLPVLGRTAKHERRSGFFPCRTIDEVRQAVAEGAEYFVPLLEEGFKEYRVHGFLGRAIRTVYKKSPTEEPPIPRPEQALTDLALKAIEALGLDFGAVDIVKEPHGDYTVLEVNTSPEVDGSDFPAWLKTLREFEQYCRAKDTVRQLTDLFPKERSISNVSR